MPDPLPYASVPPARRAATWAKWLLLSAGLCATLAGLSLLFRPGWLDSMGILGTPAAPFADNVPAWYAIPMDQSDAGYYAVAGVFLGVMLLAQWAVLTPLGDWRPKLSAQARPGKPAAVAGGLIAMLVTVGLLATVLEAGGHWRAMTVRELHNAAGVRSDDGAGARVVSLAERASVVQDFRPVWVAMGVVWAGWAVVFWRYYRTVDQWTALTRTVKWLLAGSVLNVLAGSAVHASKSGDCHCARGSYTGLVFGLTVAVWLFGPGVFLLFLRESRRFPGSRDVKLTAGTGKAEQPGTDSGNFRP